MYLKYGRRIRRKTGRLPYRSTYFVQTGQLWWPVPLLLLAGTLFLVAALLLLTYNLWDSYRADESRKEILEEYKEENRRVFSDTGSTEGEIPSLDLELPVLSEWSYPNLKLAPCRYAGSAYTDNLVIAAHNYQTYFGKLKSVREGSEVSFTDAAGNKFVYHVAAVEALTPQSVEEMTAGEWPLTLFTCTPDGKNRVTVRCE